MIDFEQKFIEEPSFLKWVFTTNPDIEAYWEEYLSDHPEEKDRLLDLKDRLTDLKFSNQTLNPFQKEELAKRIKINLRPKLQSKKNRLRVYSFMKYAAIALIFSAIAGLLVYLNTDKESFYQNQVNRMALVSSTAEGALLITSNGKKVDLKKSNSTVDYSSNGTVILNNDSVIQAPTEGVEANNQLVIPYGNQSRVVLSDNTVVWLNSGSRLIFPTLFKDKTREVLLFGEAFFEVSKNRDKPFIVKTSDLEIKVLGTQFNVSAYAEDNVIQTVLKEGSVAVRRKGAGLFEKDILIKPNQMLSFNILSKDTKIKEVNVDDYTLWTKGLISFEEIDFIQVIKKIERFYNISIKFTDPEKETIRISGKLDLKQGRKEALEYLEKVSSTKLDHVTEIKQ